MNGGRIIALSGGVGGAKLVLGLAHAVPPEWLITVTNTADDFDHFGLRICPDTDTVLYTLSGLADPEKGWGRANETWTFMQAMKDLGGTDWFNLGDGDLALHVLRTERMKKGASLTEITADVANSMGITATVLPMCDQPVATMVDTTQGRLAFQEYFVRERCAPQVTGFEFAGIDSARPNPALVAALADRPEAVIIAPSNPFVSVDPILAIPG
ncbi:MAG: 2-phospho-L-lactate transferase, partial [bacterium]|nr:2-phospho-L-lactate transferase [bacterium]